MKDAFAVMLGGAVGSLARWLVNVFFAQFAWVDSFPLATLSVNVTGSFGIGVLAGILSDEGLLTSPPTVRNLIMAGFFGGYTTFSSFSLQTLDLARNNALFSACMNVLLSVALSLCAVWLGSFTAHWLNGASLK